MYIVSSTIWEGERPIEDGGYVETESVDDVHDAVDAALANGATQIHISIHKDDTAGLDNLYED